MGWLSKNYDKIRGKSGGNRSRSTQEQWDAAGGDPDNLGFYEGLPDGGIGPQAQYKSERAVARYNEQHRNAARDVLSSYGKATQSYRPGGAAALQMGVGQGLANVHMGSQIGAPDNLYNTREDQLKKARNDARNAGYIQAGVSLASSALGAALGGGAGGALGGGPVGSGVGALGSASGAAGAGAGAATASAGNVPGSAGSAFGQGATSGALGAIKNSSLAKPGGVPTPSGGGGGGGDPPSPGPSGGGKDDGGVLGMGGVDPGFGSIAMSDQVQGTVAAIAARLGVPDTHVMHMIAQTEPSVLDHTIIDTQISRLRALMAQDWING